MGPETSRDFWGSWQLAPASTIPLLLVALLYLRANRSFGGANQRQAILFLSGLVSAALVIVTPIGVFATELFWCHMVQHIVLMMVSGPLLVLGTSSLFNPSSGIFRALSHPVVSWFLYAAVMIGVHLPGPHTFMMENSWIGIFIEVPIYLIVAYLFYFNLLDRKVSDRRISPALSVISLFLMMVPETLTGFFIYASPNSLYQEMYTLNDQRRGGSIMWSGGMIIDAIWMALAVHHWLKSEEIKSQEIDREDGNVQA